MSIVILYRHVRFVSIRVCTTVLFLAAATGCKDPWDDRGELTDPAVTQTVFGVIASEPEAAGFRSLLETTGYDKELSSDRTYTVWVPSNASVASLPADITGDPEKLKQFVAGHISFQRYPNKPGRALSRVETLNGKFISVRTDSVESARITDGNHNAKNGVFHIIDQALVPRLNIWEYINESGHGQLQKNYLLSKEYDSIDPAAGETEPGTGNHYFDQVANLEDESQEYTYFILEDEGFTRLYNELTPWFSTGTTDSTRDLASWQLVRGLAVSGVYEPSVLPDTLLSVTNVKIPVNKTDITASYRASNGIVYVLKSPGMRLRDLLPDIVVQGEEPAGFSQSDKYANIFYRLKRDPAGAAYHDIMVYGHGVSQFWVQYHIGHVPSGTYRVYWRAVAGNYDSQTVDFQQRIAFNGWDDTTFPYTSVVLRNYDEVLLGEYTVSAYGGLDLFLVSAAATAAGQNTLTLDYLRLVPVFH